jgi:PiT family inorganic phosphate transporter
MAKAGTGGLIASGIWKTVIFIIISPLFGYVLGGLLILVVSPGYAATRPSAGWTAGSAACNWCPPAMYSLGHGGNDAQKTIGIIWMLLISGGLTGGQGDPVPMWVILLCYLAIGLGTLFGGWRIVKTMGQRITKLKPVGGFCAETGGAITLTIATCLGIPVSTTHTITGAIVGVGSVRRTLRRALGPGRQHRVGLGADHSLLGADRRRRLLAGRGAFCKAHGVLDADGEKPDPRATPVS